LSDAVIGPSAGTVVDRALAGFRIVYVSFLPRRRPSASSVVVVVATRAVDAIPTLEWL